MSAQDPEGGRPATSAPSNRSWSWITVAALTAIAVIALVGVIAAYMRINPLSIATSETDVTEKSQQLPTEEEFVSNISSTSPSDTVSNEWREARADHKIIAYAIANCGHLIKKFGHAENMPRQLFTLLLLDLTPLGGHEFSSATALKEPASKRGPEPKIVASNAASDTEDNSAELTHYEQSMLFLSDAIARARLEAAKQADSTTTKAIAFGWITVALSGLATLFVAIKASMPVPKEADEKKKGYRWTFYTVGYFAMLLSATVTVLSSAKQFYDPQRTYKSSEAALLELRKLQNQVSFEFIQTWDDAKCTTDTEGNAPQLQSWAQRLANIEAVIVEASANLQDADLLKRADLVKPEDSDRADASGKYDQPPARQ